MGEGGGGVRYWYFRRMEFRIIGLLQGFLESERDQRLKYQKGVREALFAQGLCSRLGFSKESRFKV